MTLRRSDLVRFGVVGSIGFAVDLGILAVLVHGAAWDPLVARWTNLYAICHRRH